MTICKTQYQCETYKSDNVIKKTLLMLLNGKGNWTSDIFKWCI